MAHGFFVFRKANPRLVGHVGDTGDFFSKLVIAPEHNFGFFVSVTGGQGSSAARTELTDAMVGRVFPQQPAPRWAARTIRCRRRLLSQQPPRLRPGRETEIRLEGFDAGPHLVVIEDPEGKTAWRQIGAAYL